MKMKQIEQGNSLSLRPPPPLPRFRAKKAVPESVTKREIARFWCQKRIEEEEHLLAAIKAAARIRTLNLSVYGVKEEDYRRSEESLNDDGKGDKDSSSATNDSSNNASDNEVGVGIKDWWTKSKYAYLNQPAIESSVDPGGLPHLFRIVSLPRLRCSTLLLLVCFRPVDDHQLVQFK